MLPIWQTKLIISCNHTAYVHKIIINDQGCQPYFNNDLSVFRSRLEQLAFVPSIVEGRGERKEAVNLNRSISVRESIVC